MDKHCPRWWIPLNLIGIGLNLVVLWYLLVKIPSDCSALVIASQGNATCGLNAGAYVIAGICGVLVVLLVVMLIRGIELRTP